MNFKIGFNAVPFNPQVKFSGPPDCFEGISVPPPGPYDRNPFDRFHPIREFDAGSGSVINYDTFTASSEPTAVEIDDTQE